MVCLWYNTSIQENISSTTNFSDKKLLVSVVSNLDTNL